jgi:hypothetical protein
MLILKNVPINISTFLLKEAEIVLSAFFYNFFKKSSSLYPNDPNMI